MCSTTGDMKLLVACTKPRGETGRKALQRQEFAARQLAVLAGPEGDAAARALMVPCGAMEALLSLLEGGNDKGGCCFRLNMQCGKHHAQGACCSWKETLSGGRVPYVACRCIKHYQFL